MTSQQSFETPHPTPLSSKHSHCSEDYHQQLAAAAKEMGSFVLAVKHLFGETAAARAAERWVELAEDMLQPLGESASNWRHISIMAASQLALDRATTLQ